MGNVNAIGGGVHKVHALLDVGCVWVVFFCWLILQFALEFDTFNLAVELVKVWSHADHHATRSHAKPTATKAAARISLRVWFISIVL
jgi:hypothetical protein